MVCVTLTRNVKWAKAPAVIPELPLRRGTLFGEYVDGANASVKVDYALFSADGSRVFLVELKTDQGSRRDGQDKYLRAAQAVGMRQILSGIMKIVSATAAQYRPKYLHLLAQLERASMIARSCSRSQAMAGSNLVALGNRGGSHCKHHEPPDEPASLRAS